MADTGRNCNLLSCKGLRLLANRAEKNDHSSSNAVDKDKCPSYIPSLKDTDKVTLGVFFHSCGVVVKLVITPACHAGGRGFESRPLRQI